MLMLMNALNLADRQGMAAMMPVIKRDLQLTDTQLGLIQGLGFAIFYTLLGLPIARLSEHRSRSRIIAASVAMFSCFSALASQARSFTTLLLCRIGVGAGDAGFGPPVASLLGDHYAAQSRAPAMTIVWLGAPIGAMAGAVIGGWTAQHASWRYWGVGLAIPGAIVALLAFLTLREPTRGAYDPAQYKSESVPPIRAALSFFWSKKSMRHVLLGAAFSAIGLNGLGQFWARYLVTTFHIGPAQAGGLLGLLVVISMASGLAIGGFGVGWAARGDNRWYVWVPAIGLALASPLLEMGLLQDSVGRLMFWLLPAHIALFVFYTPTLTIAQNMVGANMRASSSFAVHIVLGLVGIGLGPTLVGIISDLAASHYFAPGHFAAMCPGGSAPVGSSAAIMNACGFASAHGIGVAMQCASLVLLWGCAHFLLAARTFREDIDAQYV